MVKIALEDPNKLYRDGMKKLLEKILLTKKNKAVQFCQLNRVNAVQADIIVKDFIAGEEYICQPMLKFRHKPGVLIGLYEGNKDPYHANLPLCIQNIVFINRTESVRNTRELIIRALLDYKSEYTQPKIQKCMNCNNRALTTQQIVIARYILGGCSYKQIAAMLDLNVKTISAHKLQIMKSFNLVSNCELMHFLQKINNHTPPVHLF